MVKHLKGGFSLLEILIVIVIIGVLTSIALPYYENAVQSARSAEAVIWWGNTKNWIAGRDISRTHADKTEQNANEKLKYFTLKLVCRIKDFNEICWEAEFHLKNPQQRVKYYLATQKNFLQLVCVPENGAGDSFCQTQAGQDKGPDTEINGKPAYLIRY